MPYIKQERREDFDVQIGVLAEKLTNYEDNTEPVAGEINYVISKLLVEILRKRGTSYGLANLLLGTMLCVQLEFYRRWVAPHEDEKIKENGDI